MAWFITCFFAILKMQYSNCILHEDLISTCVVTPNFAFLATVEESYQIVGSLQNFEISLHVSLIEIRSSNVRH